MRAWLQPCLLYSGHQGAKEQGSRTPQVNDWCCYFRKQHLPRRLLSQMTHSSVLCPPLPGHAHQCLSLPTLSQLTHPSLEVTVLNQLILPSLCGTRNYTDVRYTEILCKPSTVYQVFYDSRRQVKWEATDSGQCCKMGKAQCSFSLLPRCQVWGKRKEGKKTTKVW